MMAFWLLALGMAVALANWHYTLYQHHKLLKLYKTAQATITTLESRKCVHDASNDAWKKWADHVEHRCAVMQAKIYGYRRALAVFGCDIETELNATYGE